MDAGERSLTGEALQSRARLTMLDYLVIAYVIFLPMQFQTPLGPRFAPSDLFLLLYLLCGMFRFPLIRSTWSVWHWALMLVYAIGNLVSLFENGRLSQYVVVEKDFGLVMLFLGYTMIVSYATDWARFRRLIRCFILSTVWQNVVAIGAFFLGEITGINITWLNYESARLSGMLVDPNAYGGLLILAFAMHIMTSGKKNPILSGWLGTFCTVSLAIGIVLTFSRSAWIGLAMIVLAVGLFRPMYSLRLIAVGVVTFGTILLVLGGHYLDTITQMATRQSQITARLDFISTSMAAFYQQPVLGVGLGTFDMQDGFIVHNSTIWFLTEFGLVGFVVFVGFICWFFVKGVAAYRRAEETQKPLVFGLLLGHLAMYGLSMGIEAFYQRHWWLVMALLAASYGVVRREQAAGSTTNRSKEVYGHG